MSKHTPAPWDFVAEHGQSVVVYAVNDERDIAEVAAIRDDDAQTIANARLIAAAPVLLAALKELSNAHSYNSPIKIKKAAYLQARAAIRMATGDDMKED